MVPVKSTLMKCLFGIYKMDAGEIILLDGEKIEINSPDEAMKQGIAMVHQELTAGSGKKCSGKYVSW
jgi:methyl-galactoside transport system ATP-binding protein